MGSYWNLKSTPYRVIFKSGPLRSTLLRDVPSNSAQTPLSSYLAYVDDTCQMLGSMGSVWFTERVLFGSHTLCTLGIALPKSSRIGASLSTGCILLATDRR